MAHSPKVKGPDEVCSEYADREVQITLTDLDELILIRGTKSGLRFLAELLLAQADAQDTGFQISPNGAGKALFTPESTRGLYIDRIG